jgi:hypothetical protein
VAAWRQAVRTNYRVRWTALESQTPVHEDRELAACIRQYYISKITLAALRGSRPLTDFQQDLYHLLETQHYQQRHIGMLCRLPYFYAEDQAHLEIRDSLRTVMAPHNDVSVVIGLTGTLTAQRRVLRSRRRQETMEYWWADHDCRPVLWSVGLVNPLRSLVEGFFQQGQVDLRATCCIESTGQGQEAWHYLSLTEPELL